MSSAEIFTQSAMRKVLLYSAEAGLHNFTIFILHFWTPYLIVHLYEYQFYVPKTVG